MKEKITLALAAGAALAAASLLHEIQLYRRSQWVLCFSYVHGSVYPVRASAIQYVGYLHGMRVIFDQQGKFHIVHSCDEAKLDRLTGGRLVSWPKRESMTA